ncbi:hypothetical protein B0F90DRAFT_1797148 [Multifurca ochricompacta]|uniref:Uncharacterized protein n=1 Tax=Multifurca ochricompacta TaxID=376703 RepID=A0AAD4QIK9_9AGAM|nr:hypothetical protein B0F90DRAFT_1797148 [Multifurca ochricompacta]
MGRFTFLLQHMGSVPLSTPSLLHIVSLVSLYQEVLHMMSLSRLRAFSNWRKEWLRSRVANTPTTTHPDRRDNHAYSLSIHPTYDAPSGHNHPLWSAATKPRGVDEKPYTRLTTSTAVRLATGHAFIAEYTERFHPKKPPLARLCTCDDSTPATFPHILLHCSLYSVSRHTLQFLPDWALEQDPVPWRILFNRKPFVEDLLTFIQDTQAFTRPFPPERPREPN